MRHTAALALALALPGAALAQTLQSDDGTFDSMWSLTAPTAGPGDWIGSGFVPPMEFPFRVVSATMYFVDTYCCTGSVCSNAGCPDVADWDRAVIARDNLNVDPAGFTPDITTPVATLTAPHFVGAGSTATQPPWTLTPFVWTLPANTIFDAPGRVFFAIKFIQGDEYMRFANDATIPNRGTSIHTADNFTTRASIWAFGNVGMRLDVAPIFNLKLAPTNPSASFRLAGAVDVPMLALRVGGTTAATTVTRVRITAAGTANDATAVAAVRLVADLDRDGVPDVGEPVLGSGVFPADNGAVDLTVSRTIPASGFEHWLVVYDLSSAPSGGQTLRARVAATTDVSSSAGAPYLSGALDGPTLTVAGRLTIERGPQSMPSRVVPAQAQGLATLQLRLRALNEPFALTGVAVTADGSLNDTTGISSARLYVDADGSGTLTAADALLASGTYPQDNGRLAFTFAPRTIAANGTLELVVVHDLTAGAAGGDQLRTLIALPTDVTASGTFSGAVPVSGERALTGAPVLGNAATVGGALTVAIGPASPAAGTAQPGTARVPMIQLALGASAEAVDVTSLRFAAFGSGSEVLHVDRAELWADVNQNGAVDAGDAPLGSPTTYAQDDGTIAFALGEQIPAGTTRYWLLSYDFTAAPTGGETFGARLLDAAAVGARGAASAAPITPSGSFPVAGATRTMLGGLSVAVAAANPPASRAQPSAEDVPVAAWTLAAQGERFDVTRVRVVAAGSLEDAASLRRLELWRDGGTAGVRDAADVLLASGAYPADDGTATLVLSAPEAINAGTTARWLLTYDLGATAAAGETFRATLQGLDATGTLSGPASARGLPLVSATHSVGGTLLVAPGPLTPGADTVSAGAQRLAMLQVRLTAALEPISISALTWQGSGTGDEASGVMAARLYVDANRNGQVDPLTDPLLVSGTYSANDGAISAMFSERTIAAGAFEDWLIAYDLSAAVAAGQTFAVSVPSPTSVVARAPSGPLPRVQGAPVAGDPRTILGALRIARAPQSPGARTVARGSTGVPLLALDASATSEAFTVGRLRVHTAGSLDDANELVGLRLALDADASGTFGPGDPVIAGPIALTGDDGAADLGGLVRAVSPGAGERWFVLADLSSGAASGRTLRVSVDTAADVTAVGYAARPVTAVEGLPASSAVLTVGGAVTLARGSVPPPSALVARGRVGVPALHLALSADVEPATLQQLVLHGSGTADEARAVTAVRLYSDGNHNGRVDPAEPLLGTATFAADDGAATFALGEVIPTGAPLELLAVLDVSGQPLGGETLRLSVAPADVTLVSASGAVTVGGNAFSGPVLTVGGGFSVALATAGPTGGGVTQSSADVVTLAIDLFADNEACTVSSLTLTAAGSIDDRADVTRVRLWRDTNGNGLVDFADAALGAPATFARDDGAVAFTSLAGAIGRGAHQAWLVAYDLAGTASDQETFATRLLAAADVAVTCDVSGPVVAQGAPVEGPLFRVEETGALVVSRGDQTPTAAFLPPGLVRAPLLQARLRADVHDQTLDAVELEVVATGAAPAATAERVELFVDTNRDGRLDRSDRALGAAAAVDAAGRAQFAGLGLPLSAAEPTYVIAVANVAARATPGARLHARIAAAQARAQSGPVPTVGLPVDGEDMTIAGELTLSAVATTTATGVHNDDADVVLLGVRVAPTSERFTVEALTLTAEGTLDPSSGLSGLRIVEDQDGDGRADADEPVIAARLGFPEGSPRARASGLGRAVSVGASAVWLVVADLAGTARVGATLTLSIAANVDVSAVGERAGPTTPVGAPIVGRTIVVSPSLELALGPAPPPDAVVQADSADTPSLQLALTARNEDVVVSRLSFTLSGTLDDRAGVEAARLLLDANADGRLDPGDVEVATARPLADDGALSFNPLAERIARNATRAYLVVLSLSGRGTAGQTVSLSLAREADVTALGSLSGAVAASGAPVTGARLTLVGALNVVRGGASAAGVGVPAGSEFDAMQLELFTRGEGVTVDELALRLAGSADDPRDVAAAALWLDGDGDGAVGEADRPLAAAQPDADDGRLAFSGLGLHLGAGDGALLLVHLTLAEGAAPGGTLRVSLAGNDDVRARGDTSGSLAAVGAPLSGSTFTVVEPLPLVTGEPAPDSGCGCATQGSPASSTTLALALALGWALARRRQRHI